MLAHVFFQFRGSTSGWFFVHTFGGVFWNVSGSAPIHPGRLTMEPLNTPTGRGNEFIFQAIISGFSVRGVAPPDFERTVGRHSFWGGFLLRNTIDGGNLTLCDVMSWFPWNLCALLAIHEDNQGLSQGNNRWNENSQGIFSALLHIRNFQTQKFYHPNDLICNCKHFRIPNPSSKKKRKKQSFPKTSQDMGVRHYVLIRFEEGRNTQVYCT